MPTYDYRCADCGHRFEIQQSFSDDALTVCPECDGVLKKVFSAPGVSFKGSGFYKNDSRSGSGSGSSSGTSGADGAGAAAPSSDSGSGSTTTTSDTAAAKPATPAAAPAAAGSTPAAGT